MFDKERELVELGPHSYNLKEGGEGGFEYVNSNRLNVHLGEQNPMTNPEIAKKVSGTLKGRTKTDLHKERISNSLKEKNVCRRPYKLKPGRIYVNGRHTIQVQCPHCGKLGGSHAMGRWHFQNCRNRV